jgi:hypothetical protein
MATYYRDREDEERSLAEQSGSDYDRAEHLRLAGIYARLARQAELLAQGKTS